MANGKRPTAAGKPAMPGAKRNPMATARNKGQRGTAMRNPKAAGRGRMAY